MAKVLRVWHRAASYILLVVCVLSAAALAEGSSKFSIEVDFGEDAGQAFGTLFEAVDETGKVVAGAGFLNAYNTQDRSDRRLLQVYVKLPSEEFKPQRLPRVTADSGTYLYGFDNQLFAKTRNAVTDPRQKVWDPKAQAWRGDDETVPFSVAVADGVMTATSVQISFKDVPVVKLAADEGKIAEPYYALGMLIYRQHLAEKSPPLNRLVALPWKPSDGKAPDAAAAAVPLTLTTPGEFIYAYGQRQDEIMAVSNLGGVHVFDGKWRTLRHPVPNVSYQVYSIINYKDVLLLGHYPTGELFEYDGAELRRKENWPPAMPGVRKAAREAQTLAIYGGELYAGVWPWGEVWRMDPDSETWSFLGRMFSHPAPSDATTHPYENETTALDPVLNRWGQRVTSMVPWKEGLFIATSSKGGNPYEPKFTFLSGGKADEYGAVYRYQRPGCLAVPIQWTGRKTKIDILAHNRSLKVWQDGRVIGTADWANDKDMPTPKVVRWGKGVFGPLSGRVVHAQHAEWHLKLGQQSQRAAYLDLARIVDAKQPIEARQRQVREMLDRFKAVGFTVAFPYANTTSGFVTYPSEINPRRRMPDWDALGYFIEQAHVRDLEVWPAFCLLASGHFEPAGVLLDHPEWAIRQLDGKPWGFLSPANPDAVAWMIGQVREVAERYRPKGILLDYARYFNRPWQFDEPTEVKLNALLAGLKTAEERRVFRQAYAEERLTDLIRQIREALRECDPEMKLGIYSWGPHVAKEHLVAQAWPRWVADRLIDHVDISGYCYPANYGARYLEVFGDRMQEGLRLVKAGNPDATASAVIGVTTSHGRLESADEIEKYLRIANAEQLDGVSIFTWTSFEPLAEDISKRDKRPSPF